MPFNEQGFQLGNSSFKIADFLTQYGLVAELDFNDEEQGVAIFNQVTSYINGFIGAKLPLVNLDYEGQYFEGILDPETGEIIPETVFLVPVRFMLSVWIKFAQAEMLNQAGDYDLTLKLNNEGHKALTKFQSYFDLFAPASLKDTSGSNHGFSTGLYSIGDVNAFEKVENEYGIVSNKIDKKYQYIPGEPNVTLKVKEKNKVI